MAATAPASRPISAASIAIDERQLAFLREILSPKQVKQASYQAVTRTARNLTTRINRELKRDTNIDRKYEDRFAKYQTDRGDIPVATITVSGRGMPLIGFKPRVNRKTGVRVQPVKTKPPLDFRFMFSGRTKSGHVGIWQRRKLSVFGPGTTLQVLTGAGFDEDEARELLDNGAGLWGRGLRKQKRLAAGGDFPAVNERGIAKRHPIRQVYGPTPANIMGQPERIKPILAEGEELLQKNLRGQFDRFTKPKLF